MYGATGPGGCMLLIQVLTDNNTRSLNDLKRILTKHSGAICDKVQHNFDRKGVVSAASDWSLEKALELAIEAGAEDVQETQDDEEKPMLQFICDASSMKAVQSTLESLGVHTRSSSIEFISQTPSFLNPTQLETASSLLETLINYEDVVRVWDNIHTQEN
ncbi:hypothetical protein DNTS_023109 [Danionella cerebrum]|uniref:TACO1/YebC-like second and third domain-containing protein n=1 Tax=Danionella cerebrum TaxID=2873325 RepID=A0A553MZU1_9TELE|nr:hypothetical protein DNTS_023109 [Danionella translucida]